MGRPLNEAMLGQQRQIEALRRTISKQELVIDYIASLAGVSKQVVAIRRTADVENPAQPVPNPPSQPATTTTEQEATPEAYDNPLVPGQTPGSVQHLPADATGTVMDPGTTMPTSPYNNLVDVQAPVAGTETHVPNDQTRTEVDVRVGDPMNLQQAFPWTTASGANRTMASLRLAKLRLQAGTAQGDELQVAASIEGNRQVSDSNIVQEITTLSGVIRAAASRGQRPAGIVPRSASVQRTTPSLVPSGNQGLQAEAASATGSEDAEDLFI